jgi:hypothetical protein
VGAGVESAAVVDLGGEWRRKIQAALVGIEQEPESQKLVKAAE